MYILLCSQSCPKMLEINMIQCELTLACPCPDVLTLSGIIWHVLRSCQFQKKGNLYIQTDKNNLNEMTMIQPPPLKKCTKHIYFIVIHNFLFD